ncbi:transcriptional regulator [Paraburkholderia sp. J12]|uniref:transcriptional regulator n=1 Tax=Paraburkholderia sp. J12 TaxID=2805432 RepID=UPI002ABD7689|nr:transcriptional regulator [Paraburkholderia sp. J12]
MEKSGRIKDLQTAILDRDHFKIGLVQSAFAALPGFWTLHVHAARLGQDQRQPTGAAQTLLRVAVRYPKALRDLKMA